MGVTLILAPVVIASWPAISAAVVGAAAAMGMVAKESVKESVKNEQTESERIEIAVSDQAVIQNIRFEQQMTITKGSITLTIKRDIRGRCVVCAEGRGHTKAQLKQMAEEFSQKLTQCFVYNKVVTELKAKGFGIVNEETMNDASIRIHVRQQVE
jgi:ABC-type transporter MlaC component